MRRQIKGELLDGLRDELKKEPSENEWITYQCTLVTPMFGGGVEAGKVDKDMPIRASAIRGQLRFWWRIACGPKDPKVMREKEEAIWGGIGEKEAKASRVEIRVINVNFNGEVPAFEYERHRKDPSKYNSVPKPDPKFGHAYALFSAQGKLIDRGTKIGEEPKKIAKPDLCFDLEIRYKIYDKKPLSQEQISEVNEAIRWWASFGGIGSRTRRGLGAVDVKNSDIKPVSADEVTLKGGILTLVSKEERSDALACWKYGCDKLRDFRQALEVGRNLPSNNSKSPVGRSRWPEANSIRNLANTHSKKHPPDDVKTNFFPRSVFGLPIIFHYQQDQGPGQEPDDHTLTVADVDKERMASPLIIRSYLDLNDKWHSAALLLPYWREALAQSLELSPKPKKINVKPMHWSSSPEQQKMLADKDKPMNGRGDDPLSAFLEYFKEGN
ncbi:type III-B CRISPR module RAMP protein Cmr1 [Shewanella sp. SM78]|uniref:type III-B CRISPR module RAMP protein Cmr1 n=2 Tax=unclassified Shewanella TaxID=196818 RepID=UPI0021DB6A2E|nr:type III-B CRISPR module RAMP protein Cmr1 [Shewanella sp. SM78]MCU8024409.1 type III-B CRISPR module RAMP protein Cmr1 [Shewanella sp. SM78]